MLRQVSLSPRSRLKKLRFSTISTKSTDVELNLPSRAVLVQGYFISLVCLAIVAQAGLALLSSGHPSDSASRVARMTDRCTVEHLPSLSLLFAFYRQYRFLCLWCVGVCGLRAAVQVVFIPPTWVWGLHSAHLARLVEPVLVLRQ